MASIPAGRLHAWQGVPLFAPHAVMDRFGLIFGLGLVLSFGFWGTDFVQMQRALAVRKAQDAPFVPLSIGFAKLVFAMLVVVAGVAAPLVLSQESLSRNWNSTLPALMIHSYKASWLFFGFMGLAATLISTFSNNVAGFTSAWVQTFYEQWIRPRASDAHYMTVSRVTNAVAVCLAVGAAHFAGHFQSLMEYIQLILSTFNAPLLALVALAMIVPRRFSAGGSAGFLIGLACSITHQILALVHVLHYGSQMSANFYGAILGFAVGLPATLVAGSVRGAAGQCASVDRSLTVQPILIKWPAITAGIGLGGLFLFFNVFFW
jgi:SSS family solute:Na+ symporter